MKKSIFLFAFLCFAITIISCSNDDNETPTVVDPFAGNSSVEDAVITISNDDIDVAAIGAEIKSTLTDPLEANGNIEMTVPATESLAFPEEGFKIELAPQDDFDGIYVQLNGATDYLDIPKSSLNLLEEEMYFSARNGDANYELNIDFGSEVTPGTFCYEICIYDSNGNISSPIEVCVTVKFFGGNSALVGEWNLNTMKTTEGTTNSEYAVGQTLCESEDSFKCNGEIKQLNECEFIPEINIVFNQDGTYIIKFISSGTDSYEELNYETCEVVEYPSDEKNQNSREEEGKWSYDLDGENQKRLILISYKETITYTDGTNEINTYESGETDLEENVLNVFENSFDISFTYDDENEIIRTYYFSK